MQMLLRRVLARLRVAGFCCPLLGAGVNVLAVNIIYFNARDGPD